MMIGREHVAASFSPAEIRHLLAADRVFFYDGVSPDVDGFPLVVTAEPVSSAWTLADGWPIDVRGQKSPNDVRPQPVRMSEFSHIDFAPPDVRRSLQLYAEGRADTPAAVFRRMGDASGVLAVGNGGSAADHVRDAIARMRKRFPGVVASGAPGASAPAALLHALISGKGLVRRPLKDPVPAQAVLGEYATLETQMVAQTLSSDAKLIERIASLGSPSASTLRGELEREVARWTNGGSPSLVDWFEVLDSVDLEPARRDLVSPATEDLTEPGAELAPAVSGRPIDQDVLEVLASATVDGQLVRLPEVRLERRLYERVNEVLVALGGKWVARKVQAHQFEEDPSEVLAAVLTTGAFVKPQDFGFFPTPDDLVQRVLQMSGIEPGMKVLEPSAGRASIALPMAQLAGGLDNVTVCELLPANLRVLRELGFGNVIEGDFLQIEPQPIFDRVVMNPPFGGGADIAHVMHAARFLKPDGELVAITSPSWTRNVNRKSQDFREFVADVGAQVQEVQAGAFKSSGTNVATRIVRMQACEFPWFDREAEPQRVREAC